MVSKEDLIDSTELASFQEKANGALGLRGTGKMQKGLVFLPILPLVFKPAVHSDLHLHP